MKKQQAGFTLIELVLVIVILGILAATALPKFADLSTNARQAAVQGMAGGIRSAAALAHATSLAQAASGGQPVTMEGASITMVNAYPTADGNGIQAAMQDITGFSPVGTNPIVFQKTGATNPANCSVSYAAPAALGSAPTISVNLSCN